MGYSEYLKRLLKPIGVYNLEKGSYNETELEVLGMALDDCCGVVEELEQSYLPPEIEGYSVKTLAYDVDVTGGNHLTRTGLGEVLSSCGTTVTVTESGDRFTVIVAFPDIDGEPDDFPELQKWIESILPCHLNVIYSFDSI